MKLARILNVDEWALIAPVMNRRVSRPIVAVFAAVLARLERLGFEVGIVYQDKLELPFTLTHETSQWLRLVLALVRENVITKVTFNDEIEFPDEPRVYTTTITITGPQMTGYNGYANHLTDIRCTLWPALGEALERWSLQHYQPSKTRTTSYASIAAEAVAITSLPGFSPERRQAGAPHYNLTYDADTLFTWVPVRSLTRECEVFAPLQWFSFHHCQTHVHIPADASAHEYEPLLSPTITTGAGAGQTLHDAILSGLLEVIERDAYMLYWLNGLQAQQLVWQEIDDERFQQLQRITQDFNLDVRILYLRTDVPVHTFMSVVIDRTGAGPAVLVGLQSGRNAIDAAYGALRESLLARSGHRTWFETRRDEVIDLETAGHMDRVAYWAQPGREEVFEARYLQGGSVRLSELPVYEQYNTSFSTVDVLLKFFRDHDYEVLMQDITPRQLTRLSDVKTVMVRIPQFQPMHLNEQLTCDFGTRLETVPKQLGYVPQQNKNTDIHPFA